MINNIYSPNKMLSYLDKVVLHQPLLCELDITDRCNHSCIDCLSKVKLQGRCAELSLCEIDRISDGLKAMGIQAIQITGGGEPLLHKDFLEICKNLLGKGFQLSLITNGSMITMDIAEILSCFTWIRISIDAYKEETYEKIRGYPRTKFEKFLPVIKRKGCYLGASFIIQAGNFNEISQFADYCESVGFDNIRYTSNWINQNLTEEQLSCIRDQFNAIDVSIKVYNKFFDRYKQMVSHTPICFYSQVVLSIAASGKVFPCCTVKNIDSFSYGSIKENSIEDIWSSKSLMRTNLCPQCYQGIKNQPCLQFMKDNIIEKKMHEYFI